MISFVNSSSNPGMTLFDTFELLCATRIKNNKLHNCFWNNIMDVDTTCIRYLTAMLFEVFIPINVPLSCTAAPGSNQMPS